MHTQTQTQHIERGVHTSLMLCREQRAVKRVDTSVYVADVALCSSPLLSPLPPLRPVLRLRV